MFGLGFGEILVILVLALILLGPQRLPDVAKSLGKGLREFKKATEDLKDQFETELYSDPVKSAGRPSLVQPADPPAPAPVPAASADNVPGLEAATAEAAPIPAPAAEAVPPPVPAAEPGKPA